MILRIRGKVKDWRIRRDCARLIHESLVGSDKAVNIEDYLPLPFDDDLIEAREQAKRESAEETMRLYKEAKEKGLI